MAARPSDAREVERKISLRAKDFQIGPLLKLLATLGYAREDIRFESHTEVTYVGTGIEAVRFETRPSHRAVVTFNIGLLGPNGLLPSYFFDVAEQARDPEVFYDFIRFFDHRLLELFVQMLHPENDPAMYASWEDTKLFYFRMLGVGSISTLRWLFALHFPELRVNVSRQGFRSSTSIHALRTGVSHLDGSSVLGRIYQSDAAGFRVDLYAEEETNDVGTPWPPLIHGRLTDDILPLLDPLRLPLVVRLTVLTHASWAKLEHSGYLGYERVRGEEGAGHRIVIYRGHTGTEAPEVLPSGRMAVSRK